MEVHAQRLNKQQKIFVIKTFYQTDNKCETRRIFLEHFNRNIKRDTVYDLIKRFEEQGSISDLPRSGRQKTINSPENRDVIRGAMAQSPTKSTRRAALELGISRTSIRRLLHELKLKPYHPHLVHAMSEDDPDRRIEFCETFMDKCAEDPLFPSKVFWSDEAHFKLNGHVNRHNSIYWATENPHVEIQRDVNTPGITVWAAICSDGLIGPFFFSGNVSGESYVSLLNDEFFPAVRDRADIQDMWFQQDGAPAHYSNLARRWLDEKFSNQWMGRRGEVEWPARSPDLTPPDFFLWGVIKNSVYSRKPNSIQELKDQITQSFTNITPELCRKVCFSVLSRAQKCVEVNGHNFEYL